MSLALFAGPLAPPARPSCSTSCQAKKDRQILRFFRTHPRLARTPAGQREILAALLRRVHRLEQTVRTLQSARSTPEGAIRYVFGAYAEQALRVAYCETGGTYSTSATNGQYLGLFQMGDYARSAYGHGSDALTQARAAYAYFVDSGRDWSPWECKPW